MPPKIKQANKLKAQALLDLLPPDQRVAHVRNDTAEQQQHHGSWHVSVALASNLKPVQRSAIVDLFETNMKPLYEASEQGYDAAEKRAELFDVASRFLIVWSGDSDAVMVAYAMFRFDQEDTREGTRQDVLYLYELQVDPRYAGQGLGKTLVQALRTISRRLAFDKMMLTVFKANTNAQRFYDKVGFTIDPISPSVELDGEEADYYIYSMCV